MGDYSLTMLTLLGRIKLHCRLRGTIVDAPQNWRANVACVRSDIAALRILRAHQSPPKTVEELRERVPDGVDMIYWEPAGGRRLHAIHITDKASADSCITSVSARDLSKCIRLAWAVAQEMRL